MERARIPFNRTCFAGKELEYIAEAVRGGKLSGDGVFTERCSRLLEATLGVKRAFLTTSCTHALEMAALLLKLEPGDEFIVPSFTFVSTANAFALRGARPVFGDIRPDTLNLDEAQIENLITDRTKAIVPVHYAGVGCEMDAILRIAERRGVAVVEDNAHGLYGKYRSRWLGTFGALATQSFHDTKNIIAGEGGALLVNEPDYVERAEIIREKGTNRSRFFRGEVDKYTWVDIGSSYLPSEILAAFLYAQLEHSTKIQEKRGRLWTTYRDGLHHWAEATGVRLPTVPTHCEQAFHMFYLVLPSLDARTAMIARLRERGIYAVFHYQPLHLSDMGRHYGARPGDCPVTEAVADQLVRLPFYTDMTPSDQARVIEEVCAFKP